LVFLNRFQQAATPDSCWDLVGDNLADLNARGITVPFADAVIATLGIENDIEVWARDPHFPTMQKILTGLKLFQEPP
jgi:predicted nucleic acid-binding protein